MPTIKAWRKKTPVICDGDTGYGGLLNVAHTVAGYEAAGAAGIQLEDQEFPKKCGHTPGRRVIPMKDMVKKVQVAKEARSGDMLIVARTDARTTLGLDDSTLGATVRTIAGPMGIMVRADLEPERNLMRRTDHWPFMQAGVPGVSFLFGFDTTDEKAATAYRNWYENRYHAPQDDLTTLIDFQAQADFHRFWFALAEAVAICAGRAPVPQLHPVAEALTLHADRDRFVAVVCHLLRNAQEATPADGHVELSAYGRDAAAIIEVADTGSGMDEAFVRESLFRPFRTTKGNAGMGVGVYEAREFAHALGGDLDRKSVV